MLYLVIALIAAHIGFGGSGSADQQRALRGISQQPFGRVLVAVMALGLAGYACWRGIQVVKDPGEDENWHNVLLRAASAVGALFYAALAVLALRVVTGSGGASGEQGVTAAVLAVPGGVVLVCLVGAAFVATGIYQGVRGLTGDHMDDLTAGLDAGQARVVRRVGAVGFGARMVVFVILGVLLASAALGSDPDAQVGLDDALDALADQPYGAVLLLVMAAGLFAYGLLCLVQARYVDAGAT